MSTAVDERELDVMANQIRLVEPMVTGPVGFDRNLALAGTLALVSLLALLSVLFL